MSVKKIFSIIIITLFSKPTHCTERQYLFCMIKYKKKEVKKDNNKEQKKTKIFCFIHGEVLESYLQEYLKAFDTDVIYCIPLAKKKGEEIKCYFSYKFKPTKKTAIYANKEVKEEIVSDTKFSEKEFIHLSQKLLDTNSDNITSDSSIRELFRKKTLKADFQKSEKIIIYKDKDKHYVEPLEKYIRHKRGYIFSVFTALTSILTGIFFKIKKDRGSSETEDPAPINEKAEPKIEKRKPFQSV